MSIGQLETHIVDKMFMVSFMLQEEMGQKLLFWWPLGKPLTANQTSMA